MADPWALLPALAAGIALAATAGLRAFLPLFAVGLAGRLGWIHLGSSFGWLESTPALVAFGSAVVLELLGDKFPAVDHALDAIGVVVKPIAGTLVFTAVLGDMDPWLRTTIGIVGGATVAGGTHLVKAKTRIGSSLLTMGIANPVLSFAEDALALTTATLAVLWPAVALVLVVLAAAGLYATFRLARGTFRAARRAVEI